MDIQTKTAFDLFIKWYNSRTPVGKYKICRHLIHGDENMYSFPRPVMPMGFAEDFLVAMWRHISWNEIRTEFVKMVESGELADMSDLFLSRVNHEE